MAHGKKRGSGLWLEGGPRKEFLLAAQILGGSIKARVDNIADEGEPSSETSLSRGWSLWNRRLTY